MAVLEKIRKRSVLLFIIIIGALLAFILGDFLNSGRTFFGPGDTYAEVGDVKLKQDRFVELQDRFGKQYADADPDAVTDMVIEAGIMEGLYEREFERMGIKVSDDMLTAMVYDPRNYALVFSTLVPEEDDLAYLGQIGLWRGEYRPYGNQQQIPYIDVTVYRDAIDKPSNYKLDEATAKMLSDRWEKMESEVERQIKMQLYNTMLAGLFQPNKADALVQFENSNAVYDVDYVAVATGTAGDVKVEDADFQNVYDLYKGAFRILDEKREIAYVYVPVLPSADDYSKANVAFNQARTQLETTNGTTALNSIKGISTKNFTGTTNDAILWMQQTGDSRPMAVASDTAVTENQVRVMPMQQNVLSMVKVLGIENAYDNVDLSLLSAQTVKELDSIFVDRSAEAVEKVFADNVNKGAFSGKISLASDADESGAIIKQIKNLKNAVENAPLNELTFVTDTVNGQILNYAVMVKERSNKVPVYNMVLVDYTIHPSAETRNKLTQDLNNFIANNGTAETFVEKAAEAGYDVVYNVVDETSYTVGTHNDVTPGSRKVVKWVMNNDKGTVSPLFTLSGKNNESYLVAVAVTDIFDDEYIPATSNFAKQELEGLALENKKAKTLVDKYAGKGKTLADYSKAMGAAVTPATVVFGSNQLGNKAKGAVAGAKKGSVLGPVEGNGQVYVIEVKNVKNADFAKADLDQLYQQLRSQYGSTFKMVNINNPSLYIGDRKVSNNMLYFTADESKGNR